MPGQSYSIKDSALSTTSLFSNAGYDKLFEVRPPQRRYKWNKEQVKDLWDDIVQAAEKQRDSYFLGTLLVSPTDPPSKTVSVIDGQQRIATLTLLLAVLRDSCLHFEELKDRAQVIHGLINRLTSGGTASGELVVTLQPPDKEPFVKLVEEKESTTTVAPKSKQDRLANALQSLRSFVADYIDLDGPDPCRSANLLESICIYIQEKLKFLVLEVGGEIEASLVFDTTNTRGLDLSLHERWKSRLTIVAREDQVLSEALLRKWNHVAGKLEEAGLDLDAMDDFLYAVYSSHYDPAISKRSLANPAKKLNTPEKVRKFIDVMDSCCDSYLKVTCPDTNSWLGRDLEDLKDLNKQSRPLLMTVHKYSAPRFDEAVNLVLTLQIRNITVGNGQPHDYENLWPKWANSVFAGQVDGVFKDMRERLEADHAFRESFAKAKPGSAAIARHLLRRLDPVCAPGSGVAPFKVDIEHIMPKGVIDKLTGAKKLTPNTRKWISDMSGLIFQQLLPE